MINKILTILTTILAVVAFGLKVKSDRYEDEADNAEAQMQANDQIAEVKSFEAIQANEAKHAEQKKKEIDGEKYDDTIYDITL